MTAASSKTVPKFTPYQKFVVGILTFLQFTIILDFMVLSPLGAMLMPSLKISTTQFGLVVSAYAFSAGISGLFAASFADRFDRKKLLLFFYSGFVVGTIFCGIAPNYEWLLLARVVTGIFGGVVGSIVFAITTDLFPYEMRGRVMGFLQTAFSASQILGVPFSLYLSNHYGWHFAFYFIALVAAFVGVLIVRYLKPIDGHLALRTEKSGVAHMFRTVANRRYLMGFASTALLATGGFMLMPFASNFSVHNLGVKMDELPLIYLVSGICSMIIGPGLGILSDRIGKLPTFIAGSILSIIMVVIYTRMEISPLWLVMAINVIMFVGVSARMISSSALSSALPDPAHRGAYMAISSSLQQVSGGIAAAAAGMIVIQRPDGYLERFDVLGDVIVVTTLITMFFMWQIHRLVRKP